MSMSDTTWMKKTWDQGLPRTTLRRGRLNVRVDYLYTNSYRSANLDDLAGIIHFLDYPDPTHTSEPANGRPAIKAKNEPVKPPVNTRLVLSVADVKVPSLMQSINYKFVTL